MAPLDFETLYLRARTIEKRIYSDEIVAQLPIIDKTDIHYQEWRIRKSSLSKLSDHINKKGAPVSILEIGCGNGWFANQLALLHNVTVCGIDPNRKEIEQAKKVFQKNPNLKFLLGDLQANQSVLLKYDIILLAGTIQYFPDLNNLLNRIMQLLTDKGEIHIIDSPFYSLKEIAAAKKRTLNYYSKLGVPELSEFYHHHSLTELSSYSPKFLQRPKRSILFLKKCFGLPASPFPWVVILAQENK